MKMYAYAEMLGDTGKRFNYPCLGPIGMFDHNQPQLTPVAVGCDTGYAPSNPQTTGAILYSYPWIPADSRTFLLKPRQRSKAGY